MVWQPVQLIQPERTTQRLYIYIKTGKVFGGGGLKLAGCDQLIQSVCGQRFVSVQQYY
jgi:hypothetical protein